MKIDDIAAFAAVVRHHSLSLAAHALGLTQPMLTRRVQGFEQALGVVLLDRATKPLQPTAQGLRVYEQCCAVLREVDSLRELAGAEPPLTGGLRLGLTQGIGELVLPALLAELEARWPGLEPHACTGWGGPLLERLERRELDATAVFLPRGKPLPRNVEGRMLLRTRLVVVARKGAWARRSYRLADCQGAGWVLNPDGCGFRAGLQRALAERGLPLEVRLDAFGRDLQLYSVAQGLGLGLVPLPLLEGSRHAAQLQTVPVSDFKPEVELWLAHGPLPERLREPVACFAQRVEAALAAPVAA
ncbi:MAG TPA: LysR family transcriptional regulator [Burkholderiaceae bacterium]